MDRDKLRRKVEKQTVRDHTNMRHWADRRKRRYDNCPEIFYCQTSSIRLQADHPLPWTIDGEYKGDFAEADIRILPQALELIR